jgi:hypothetical protein
MRSIYTGGRRRIDEAFRPSIRVVSAMMHTHQTGGGSGGAGGRVRQLQFVSGIAADWPVFSVPLTNPAAWDYAPDPRREWRLVRFRR